MSDIRTWPVGLNYRPERAGYRWTPHDPQSRTPMEQGPARKRRKWVSSPAYVQVTWIFTGTHYDVFRAWHHLQLDDGANWFRMPLWCGNAFVTLPCRFKGAFQPTPRGLEWVVTAEIEVREVPFAEPEDLPDLLVRDWPEAINPLPIRDAYRMTPHRPVIRSEIDGPQDTKLWYQDGAIAAEFQWPMSPDAFTYFRAWYHHSLKDGVAWFTAPAWVGGAYGTRQCRFENAYEATLQLDYTWLVTASVEIRNVPYMADGALYIATIFGGEAFAGFVADIHHIIHVEYPEATT